MDLNLKELIAVFIPLVAFLNFLFSKMKTRIKIFILFVAGVVSYWLINDLYNFPEKTQNSETQTTPIDLMKKVNLYSDMEYIKQEIGVPKEKMNFGERWYEVHYWELDGVYINLSFKEGIPNSISYELKDDVYIDIYSPKGNKLYDRSLGKIDMNYIQSKIFPILFVPHTRQFKIKSTVHHMA